jgi:DNA polymerase-3 subunit epsilon
MRTRYLDTETTGLSHARDEVLELALLDEDGQPLIDTLVRPLRLTRWPDAQAIHGITPEMVQGAPTLAELVPQLVQHLTGAHLVVYNLDYDLGFMPASVRQAPLELSCCMNAFAEHYGEPGWYGGYRWQKLTLAADHARHAWAGSAHRARADADACRSVWRYLAALKP